MTKDWETARRLVEQWFATHREWPNDQEWAESLAERVAAALAEARREERERYATEIALANCGHGLKRRVRYVRLMVRVCPDCGKALYDGLGTVRLTIHGVDAPRRHQA